MERNGRQRIFVPTRLLCCLVLLAGHCAARTCTPWGAATKCRHEFNCAYGCQENYRALLTREIVHDCSHAVTRYVGSTVETVGEECAKLPTIENLITNYTSNNFNLSNCYTGATFHLCKERSPYKLSIVIGYNIWSAAWVILVGVTYKSIFQRNREVAAHSDEDQTFSKESFSKAPSNIPASIASSFQNPAYFRL